jgi:hypothetical protein
MGRPEDGAGTVWVHDPPDRNGDPDEVNEPAPFAPPARPSSDLSVSRAPEPFMLPPPERSSPWGSTGCLLLLFVGGGIGIGLAALLALAMVGAAFWLRTG